MSNLRVVSALVLSGFVGACASGSPPPAKSAAAVAPAAVLAPAKPPVKLLGLAEARGLELAAVSVSSLDRTLTNGATLVGKAVPLPIEPAGLRDMLLGQAGLPPEVSANLDLGAPAGAAVVSTGTVGGTGAVMAVAARGVAEAGRVVTALGKQIEKRGDVVLVESASGSRGWIWRDGAVIVFSDDVEALSRGARLAEEARHPVAEDVTAVLYPDAMARANGTDVKTALAQFLAQLQAAQASAPGGGAAASSTESLQEIVALVGDAEAVELGLSIDAAKGITVQVRLRARPGSGLEKVARDVHPYELDGTLLAAEKTPAVVAASSIGAFMRAQMGRQRDRLKDSKAKGAAAALAFQDAMQAALGGQSAFTMGFSREAPVFSGALTYPLKDAKTAAALGAALIHLDRAAALALVETQVGSMALFDWSVKKESVGKLKALHYTLGVKKDSVLDAAVVKKLFGKGLDVYTAVSGTRMLATFGRDAKAGLGRIASAAAVAPSGALAETLAATKGRDSFFQFDVGALLPVIATLVKDKKVETILKGEWKPIPLYATAGGDGVGKEWSAALTIPQLAFIDAGDLVKKAMAAGISSASAPEEPAQATPPPKKKSGKHAK
jgi:hypothetical protein